MTATMTLAEAEAWLEGLINYERAPSYAAARLDLAAIEALLDRLERPEARLSVLHVAGSKGKGSVALLLEALLAELGERIGTFTSPHLESWVERFRVAGRPSDADRLAVAVARIRPHVEALRSEAAGPTPTFFDATTAAALCLFADAGLDRVILEVGLGGRLDSTNAVAPAIGCITTIELEHTDKLGHTLAAIAGEKAGILKPGVPAAIGDVAPEAWAVIEARAREVGAPLWRLGRDFEVASEAGEGGCAMRYRDRRGLEVEAEIALLGDHHGHNAALALAMLQLLGAWSNESLATSARRAFARVVLPGRVELLGRAPWVVIDSAHTPASARALARALAPLPARERHWVVSISAGKDLGAILEAWLSDATTVTLTRAEPRRSLDPTEVARAVSAVRPDCEVRVVPNPHLALRAAREGLPADALLCASGSVYLAGIARRVWRETLLRPVAVSRRGGLAAGSP